VFENQSFFPIIRYFSEIPDREGLTAEVDLLERMVKESGVDVVFSHGDLVHANVIYDEQNGKAFRIYDHGRIHRFHG
jgi:thiamine kinase-like enzyme